MNPISTASARPRARLIAAAMLGLLAGTAPLAAQEAASGTSAPETAATLRPAGTDNAPKAIFRLHPDRPDTPAAAPAAAPTVTSPPPPQRIILSDDSQRLTGEMASANATVFLSADEAARPATFSIGYRNAVAVVPEASQLSVFVNGEALTQIPINSARDDSRVTVPVPAGLLQAGANHVVIRAAMRHRVDCSLSATYELWTDLIPAMTGFSFDGPPARLSGFTDLAAIGVDDKGTSHIDIVRVGGIAAGTDDAAAIAGISGSVALLGRMSHPVVQITDTPPQTAQPGHLTVLIGQAADVARLTSVGAATAAHDPAFEFASDPRTGIPTLVISGPGRDDVAAAATMFVAQARTLTTADGTARPWRLPDTVRLEGGETVTLANLGLTTETFSGRRFQDGFTIELPADFYGSENGTARLRLNAAFAPHVEAGSTLSILVNGNVAAAVRVPREGGMLLDGYTLRLPMTQFRPGLNRISFEGELMTAADRACAPGTTMNMAERFALFDTSTFTVPRFGRLGHWPNLSAFAADGFPMGGGPDDPIPLMVGTGDAALSAAATLLSRLSLSVGTPVAVRSVAPSAVEERDSALIVAPVNQLPPAVGAVTFPAGLAALPTPVRTLLDSGGRRDGYNDALERLKTLESQSRLPEAGSEPADNARALYNSWRANVTGTAPTDAKESLVAALMPRAAREPLAGGQRNLPAGGFALTQVAASRPGPLEWLLPGSAPAAWTVATAPDAAALAAGAAAITMPSTWAELHGGTAILNPRQDNEPTFYAAPVEVDSGDLLVSGPANLRRVIGNWFSFNIKTYVAVIAVLALVSGVCGWAFIRRVGRRSMA